MASSTLANGPPSAQRDAKGHFLPGQSGNPGGRPLGFAEQIRAETGDGEELYQFALRVLRGEQHSIEVRMAALKWLADRGWGRAPEIITVTQGFRAEPGGWDLDKLSAEDMLTMLDISRRARGALPEAGEVIAPVPIPEFATATLEPVPG